MVARWAHNPKAVGSNPTPATNKIKGLDKNLNPLIFSTLPINKKADQFCVESFTINSKYVSEHYNKTDLTLLYNESKK
mgnify:FL=1